MRHYPNLALAIAGCARTLYNTGLISPTKEWQSSESNRLLFEAIGVGFQAPMPGGISTLSELVVPNLPWAEDHFQERVGGVPLNPGNEYKNWPFYKGKQNDKFRTVAPAGCTEGMFSHTYMERMWTPKLKGYRYTYGNLSSVVAHLYHKPYSRQAYLPIWFPEDTGVVHGERVPCSLGYHFILRNGYLHCTYYMRSVDFLRHFRDDVYLAVRLTQWVLQELKLRKGEWKGVSPGLLRMDMVNLHVFEGEQELLKKHFNG